MKVKGYFVTQPRRSWRKPATSGLQNVFKGNCII